MTESATEVHPSVTVIMSVYNSESTLSEAVESIIEQTLKDWEYLVVDDGSRDGSRQLLEKFANQDHRIRIINNPGNMGLAYSLNKAWREGKGKYIARMDADDYSLPHRLATQVEFLDTHPGVDVIGSNAILESDTGNSLGITSMPLLPDQISAKIDRLNPLVHPSVMMRREFIEAMGGYDDTLRKKQDYDLWLRAADQSNFQNLEAPLIRYRVKQSDSFQSDYYGFRVRVRHAVKRGKIITGMYWAVVTLLVNIFRKLGYRQRFTRS
jgi:glycosyltransferase involved in cell wall biosynthesis